MELTTINPAAQQQKLGRRYIPADACIYPPAVMPDDMLLVDLDHDIVSSDSLYLLERLQDGAVTWMGCRRLETAITGGLRVDETGRGDWVPMPDKGGLRIAGRVVRVYRPTDKVERIG